MNLPHPLNSTPRQTGNGYSYPKCLEDFVPVTAKKQNAMRKLTIVAERECTEAYQHALRRFVCCVIDAPEYEKEVQRYIRGIKLRSACESIRRKLLVIPATHVADETVIGFCEYGVDGDDSYAISYIAIAQEYQGHGPGSFLLKCVLADFADEQWHTPRNAIVGTMIHHHNLASRALFIGADFQPDGPADDPEYGIWYKYVTPRLRGPEYSILIPL